MDKKTLQKLDNDLDVIKSIIERSFTASIASKQEANTFNNILIGINLLKEDFIEKNDKKFIPDELNEIWTEWKRHRYFKNRVYSSSIEEAKAFKKIMELSEADINQFTNIIEWAIALGYTDILPAILEKIEHKKTDDNTHLFKDSKYNDIYTLCVHLFNIKSYEEINFEEYLRRATEWSENEGKTKANWGGVIHSWIDKDMRAGKLDRLSKSSRDKLTTKGDKLEETWKKILTHIKPNVENDDFINIFMKIKPISIFRFTITLQLESKETYQTLENKYFEIMKTSFRKNKIYAPKYVLK